MKRKIITILLITVMLVIACTSFAFAAGKGTGLYNDGGKWKYYENGRFKSVTGLVQKPGGTWHYVENGIYKRSTGLVQCVQPGSSNGNWYYVYKGDLNKKATGLVQCIQPGSSKGKWYYVRDGKLKKSTGLTKCIQPGSSYGKTYYVQKGKKSTYTGIVKDGGKKYYVKKGKLMSDYSGNIKLNGVDYKVTNGVAKERTAGWQDAFIKHINNREYVEDYLYTFYDINGDGADEMIEKGKYSAAGGWIYTYFDGSLRKLGIAGGDRGYVVIAEGKNRILTTYGAMGHFENSIYRMKNGKFVQLEHQSGQTESGYPDGMEKGFYSQYGGRGNMLFIYGGDGKSYYDAVSYLRGRK